MHYMRGLNRIFLTWAFSVPQVSLGLTRELFRCIHSYQSLDEVVLVDRKKFSWRTLRPGTNPHSIWAFDNDSFLLAKRYILQPALLDQTLVPVAFDALVRLQIQRRKQQLNPPAPVTDEGEFAFIQFNFLGG